VILLSGNQFPSPILWRVCLPSSRKRFLINRIVRSHGVTDKLNKTLQSGQLILWHVDPLLGNDREKSNFTTTLSKLRLRKQTCLLGNNCTETEEPFFSVQFVLRCYKRNKWGVSQLSLFVSDLGNGGGSDAVNLNLVPQVAESSGTQ
jgi:hypothetical protein